MTTELLAAKRFLELHPVEAARILDRHDPKEILEVMEELPEQLAAAVVPRLTGSLGARCLGLMKPGAAGAILSLMTAETAARLVRRMAPDSRNNLLEEISLPRRQGLRRLLAYAEGTVGALMEPNPPTLQASVSAAEAAQSLTSNGKPPADGIYVVDHSQRLTGMVQAAELASAPATACVADLTTAAAATLSPHDAVGTASSHPAWMEADELPVVDLDGLLQGAVGHRQLRVWSGSQRSGERSDPLKTALGVVELMWVGLFGLMETVATVEDKS